MKFSQFNFMDVSAYQADSHLVCPPSFIFHSKLPNNPKKEAKPLEKRIICYDMQMVLRMTQGKHLQYEQGSCDKNKSINPASAAAERLLGHEKFD
jgi:hypothetical protein